MPERTANVRALFLPLRKDGVLLPLANVAEIVVFMPPVEDAGNEPAWHVGSVPWRGRALPLCTLEPMVGESYMPPGARGRIVVLHGLAHAKTLPYLGFVIQAPPSVVRATPASAHWVTDRASVYVPAYAVGWVDAGGHQAWIPNLDTIERELTETQS